MSFKKLTSVIPLPRLSGGNQRYTDTNEFLSPAVLVAYKKRPGYPPLATKTAVNQAAVRARHLVRKANDEIAKVVILRKNESALFTSVMERHFNLSSTGGTGGGYLTDNVINKPFSPGAILKHDRRWFLEKIRQRMLTLSFHLNTGIYLIDMDNSQRTVDGGAPVAAGTANPATTEAYVFRWGANGAHLCGFRNGEIHVEFPLIPTYTRNSAARVIIHEAGHKFLNADDTYYAHNPAYPPSMQDCLKNNPDSFAWAAVSLATGTLRMPTAASGDWANCP